MGDNDMTKKRALVSVSDKTHLTDFCQCLVQLNYEILSTGGTAKALTEAGIPVTAVVVSTDRGNFRREVRIAAGPRQERILQSVNVLV